MLLGVAELAFVGKTGQCRKHVALGIWVGSGCRQHIAYYFLQNMNTSVKLTGIISMDHSPKEEKYKILPTENNYRGLGQRLNCDGEAMHHGEKQGSAAVEDKESQQSDGDEWIVEEMGVSRKTSGVHGINLVEHQLSTRRKTSDVYEILSPVPFVLKMKGKSISYESVGTVCWQNINWSCWERRFQSNISDFASWFICYRWWRMFRWNIQQL